MRGGKLRRDVAIVKRGFIADGERVPGGFLFADGADQRGIERVRKRGGSGERDEFGRGHGSGMLHDVIFVRGRGKGAANGSNQAH